MKQFNHLPSPHREFLLSAVEKLKNDLRILGVAAGGSLILNNIDEYSDLDLVIVVDPAKYPELFQERKHIAQNMGPLLESFTGEHVCEPRLLICLYGPPLLHVDLKFISLDDINNRVEDPVVIWERDSILNTRLSGEKAKFPSPDLEWIENRFWVWIYYIAAKIGRGELFETIEGLSFLRTQVLGPMILHRAGARPQGVRRIETCGFAYLDKLKETLPRHDRESCFHALEAAIELYRNLRTELLKDQAALSNQRLITEVKKYLKDIKRKVHPINAYLDLWILKILRKKLVIFLNP